MKYGIIVVVLLLMAFSLVADNQFDFQKMTQDWYQIHPDMPPHWMTPAESAYRDEYVRTFTETAPPTAPVRGVAEFEQSTSALIRWPLGIPYTVVAELSQDVQVITIVASTSQQNSATSAYQSNGVNMANCTFMIAPTDSYWTRDFGPWFVFDGNNQLGVVDFVYNRPRPNDDEIPRTFATQAGLPLFGMNLQQTGGNYMTDGYGTVAQTTLVYDENSNNQTNVNTKMHDYMGATTYDVVADPNNTYIDHIDCWGKFLAPDKVLIRSVPTTHAQYSSIEAAANYFATHNCGYGYPFQVYRVYTPSDQPYTNSLILNNKVFVPQMGNSNDAAALQSYRTAMPGYEVIGFTGASSTPWESTDALHCRVHEIIDKNMLFVRHIPVHGTVAYGQPIRLNVNFIASSGQALYPDSLKICYKVNGGTYQTANLIANGSDPTLYQYTMTNIIPGSQVQYFIHGADHSGHSTSVPRMGALDPFTFTVGADTQAPVIQMTAIPNLMITDFPYQVFAHVTDNAGINQVSFSYGVNTSTLSHTLQPISTENGDYTFQIPAEFITNGDSVYYQVSASDIAVPTNTASTQIQMFHVGPVQLNDNTAMYAQDVFMGIYPNPASLRFMSDSNAVSLKYHAKSTRKVTFEIYNIKGQLVRTIQGQSTGQTTDILSWNGKDARGQKVRPGLYLVRMQNGMREQTKKLAVIE
ncbi:MAG TPA: agmatine deiminase family protein [Candidatus Cloacimonadota bacterium]|nr:agmatine deiminase family protein [Candidatus Cloacimonadota bacterium]